MKKEEKVAEILIEAGHKVSEEDVLIGQLIPNFLGSFFTIIPKRFFLAYNDKQLFVIGQTLMKGDPDKNKIKYYSLNEINIQIKKGLLTGKLIITLPNGKKENYRIFKFALVGSSASKNFKKALEKFQ